MINLLIKFAIKFANMIIIAYLCSRNRMKKRDIMASTGIKETCRSALRGIGSLGNISGGYARFDRYVKGNNANNLRGDWERVGRCLREYL